MASIISAGTGTASSTVSLTQPPGAAGGNTAGLRKIVIDSIFVSLSCSTAATGCAINVRRNAVTQFSFGANFQVPASSSKEIHLTFPGGFPVPGDDSVIADVNAGGTNVTATAVAVTYHYE